MPTAARSVRDKMLTDNPKYPIMGDTVIERQDSYKRFVLEDRLYEDIIDNKFGID